jgi:hypothetical protein
VQFGREQRELTVQVRHQRGRSCELAAADGVLDLECGVRRRLRGEREQQALQRVRTAQRALGASCVARPCCRSRIWVRWSRRNAPDDVLQHLLVVIHVAAQRL